MFWLQGASNIVGASVIIIRGTRYSWSETLTKESRELFMSPSNIAEVIGMMRTRTF